MRRGRIFFLLALIVVIVIALVYLVYSKGLLSPKVEGTNEGGNELSIHPNTRGHNQGRGGYATGGAR